MVKKIAHIDMDAFYVSIEIRDNPSLLDKPVAVGGKSNQRGVLSTCNYIAREYGIHSAMPTKLALQKCPDLIVLPGRMDIYKEVSKQIRNICDRYSDKIEPLSLDEMYLDLTDSQLHRGSATLTVQEIRHEIFSETGLTASAGVAPLKFLAKIASDLNKPNGQFTISPQNIMDFIEKLELKKISGVGKVTQDKLAKLGLITGGDILNSNQSFMIKHFGKYGNVLWDRCHGIDNRVVEVSRARKSVAVERTFEQDISSLDSLFEILEGKLLPELLIRAEKYLKEQRVNKIGVKVKFSDFQQTTKEQKCSDITLCDLKLLLEKAILRGSGKSVRLLGVHIGIEDTNIELEQLGFKFN